MLDFHPDALADEERPAFGSDFDDAFQGLDIIDHEGLEYFVAFWGKPTGHMLDPSLPGSASVGVVFNDDFLAFFLT